MSVMLVPIASYDPESAVDIGSSLLGFLELGQYMDIIEKNIINDTICSILDLKVESFGLALRS